MHHFNPRQLLELFNRRYALALLAILLCQHWQNRSAMTLESIYSRWDHLRPSRSTFSRLINEFADNGVIYLKEGDKKSAKIIEINQAFLTFTGLNQQISFEHFLQKAAGYLTDA